MIFTLFCFANLVFEKPHSHHQGLKILPDNMIIKIPQKKRRLKRFKVRILSNTLNFGTRMADMNISVNCLPDVILF